MIPVKKHLSIVLIFFVLVVSLLWQSSSASSSSPDPQLPEPELGRWNVTEGNITCIQVELQMVFTVPVPGQTKHILLSPNATSNGSCNSPNSSQKLVLEHDNYSLTMLFLRESELTFVNRLEISYAEAPEPFYNDEKLFSMKNGNSYECDSTTVISLGNASVTIEHFHIEAFRTSKEATFSTADLCPQEIARQVFMMGIVGCALAILIVAVVISYCVARRRSRQKLYATV